MSRVLDAMTLPLDAVRRDLTGGRKVSVSKGRKGLSAEQVLRAELVKQMFDVSYDELAFHLEDSLQLRAFCRLAAVGLAAEEVGAAGQHRRDTRQDLGDGEQGY